MTVRNIGKIKENKRDNLLNHVVLPQKLIAANKYTALKFHYQIMVIILQFPLAYVSQSELLLFTNSTIC